MDPEPTTDPTPEPEPTPAPNPEPTPDPEPEPDDAAERNRRGFEQRQLKKQLDDLRKELDGYKRRDEDARKAKLTEEQRLKEERDSAVAEAEKLKAEALRNKVAREFKLPDAVAARLIGSDEEALRADAAELAKLLPKPKAGSATDPVRDGQGGTPTFKRSQLRDPAFYKANEAAIRQAAREGRITDG